jgi:SAM-dependent methyltransferase
MSLSTTNSNDAAGSPGFNAPAHVPYQIDPTNRFHGYENHWKEVALQLLAKHCDPKGKTVLDYGCGRGETLEIYGKAGFAVTGTDTDTECVRLASRFGPAQILQPEKAVEQFGKKSFDVVTCFHVLEHVPCPRQTLSDIASITRDYALLAVPNLRQLRWIGTRRIELGWVNEGHLQAWDHWHFLNLAQRFCGLDLVEWGFDATILPGVSELAAKIGGNRLAVRLETGLFRRLFPYHGISVLGLFRVRR